MKMMLEDRKRKSVVKQSKKDKIEKWNKQCNKQFTLRDINKDYKGIIYTYNMMKYFVYKYLYL